jgi:hypothetical protein
MGSRVPYGIAQGGLFRCCLSSLGDFMSTQNEPPANGTIHKCKFDCITVMIYEDGVWRWDKERSNATVEASRP